MWLLRQHVFSFMLMLYVLDVALTGGRYGIKRGETKLFSSKILLSLGQRSGLLRSDPGLCVLTMTPDKIPICRVFVDGCLVLFFPIQQRIVEVMDSPAQELKCWVTEFSAGDQRQCGMHIKTGDAAIGRELKDLFVKILREAPPADNVAVRVAQILAY
jgi:hypothetical protein